MKDPIRGIKMYYIADIYSYYDCDEQVQTVTVLAMAKNWNEICEFAKQINEGKEYACYFGYCHSIGVYKTNGLVPPHTLKNMERFLPFRDLL